VLEGFWIGGQRDYRYIQMRLASDQKQINEPLPWIVNNTIKTHYTKPTSMHANQTKL